MTLIVDGSAVAAALVDDGPHGRWAEHLLSTGPLAAPQLMPVEVANILRRATMVSAITADVAGIAHADLLQLPVELFPYAPLAERVWQLRQNVTAYDAWYVALAEELDAPLITLDGRLARSTGPRCQFLTPSGLHRA